MPLMNYNRREFVQLVGGTSVLGILAPLSALANNDKKPVFERPELPLEVERQQLIDEVREKALGFDLREVINRMIGHFDFIPEIRERIDEALEGVDTKHGLRSLRMVNQYKVQKAFSACKKEHCIPKHVITDKIHSLLSVASNLISPQEKKDPKAVEFYKEKISNLTSLLVNSTLDIDNEKLSRHIQRYPENDMVIFYGPITQGIEMFGGIFHQTFANYLQMSHGRRATKLWPAVDPSGTPQATDIRGLFNNPQLHNLAQALFNPKYQHVALISHGSWDSYSFSGACLDPEAILAKLLALYSKDPSMAVEVIESMLKGSNVPGPISSLSITNHKLDYWINNLCHLTGLPRDEFDRRFQKSGKFIRYTCGYEKYELTDSKAYWKIKKFLPKEIQEMIKYGESSMSRSKGFSAEDPTFVGKYEIAFRQALDRYNQRYKKNVEIKEVPGFGAPLVQDPTQLYGFEGGAWIDDYIENPIPKQGKI